MRYNKKLFRFYGIGFLSIILAVVIYFLTTLNLFEHPFLYVVITI
jgi:hypothetical protein